MSRTIMRVLLSFVLLSVVCTIFFMRWQNLNKSKTSRRREKYKYVLYWTSSCGRIDFGMGFGTAPFKACQYKNCLATRNRTLKPIDEFDAIAFHAFIYSPKAHGKPNRRSPNQIYIFNNMEAPAHIAPNFRQFNSFYNWTMTYRFDSDIVHRHGKILAQNSLYTPPTVEEIQNRTKLIAWFVSDCKTSSKREELVARMQKFVPVDVYGSCGPLKCPKKSNCYDMLEKEYKFYLSFENSICKDYSTEKLYNILKKNVIPVVYGAGDYALSAPPNSAINVADFTSVEHLTKYLRHLDENVTEYLKYFEWKKKYRIGASTQACDICRKLHEPIRQSIYHDLHGWSWGKNKEICKTGKSLPKLL